MPFLTGVKAGTWRVRVCVRVRRQRAGRTTRLTPCHVLACRCSAWVAPPPASRGAAGPTVPALPSLELAALRHGGVAVRVVWSWRRRGCVGGRWPRRRVARDARGAAAGRAARRAEGRLLLGAGTAEAGQDKRHAERTFECFEPLKRAPCCRASSGVPRPCGARRGCASSATAPSRLEALVADAARLDVSSFLSPLSPPRPARPPA